MSNLLCDICSAIFKGPKPERSRAGEAPAVFDHLKSLEQLQSGICTGCVVCTGLARRVASKSTGLETLDSFTSGYLFFDFGHPGHITFLLTWKIDGKVENGVLDFNLLPLSSESVSGGYVTLSHRWGSSPFLQLNLETMNALTAGIPIHELPATFQDAIYIAQQLDSREDWIREAPTMRNVYGFAVVNIVAGHSDGPQDGLFPPRNLASVESVVVQSKWDNQIKTNYLLWDESALQDDFESAPLTQRGWVFQERLLAPRILQFGKRQVYWRCSELFASEAWPQGVRSATGKALRLGTDLDALDEKACMEIPPISKWRQLAANTVSQEPVAIWERLVAQYSRTKLTFGDDKLVALSGVAKLFQQTFKDRYLAGVWWSPSARLLCWSRDDRRETGVVTRPDYRAPSWSWASIDGLIDFTARIPAIDCPLLLEEYLAEVINASVVPLGNDEMAQVQGGQMTVKSGLHSFKVISQQESQLTFEMDGKVIKGEEGTFVLDTALQDELKYQQLWIMPTMLVVQGMPGGPWSSAEGMVLKKSETQGGAGAGDTYERIGYLFAPPVKGDRGVELFGLHVETIDGDSETGSTLRIRRETGLLQTVTIV
ncbi:uncharacterized protein NECHADRAFT_85399 [Fusarium vanettenii 77-13-4]|uniref:Heterokaryon incompatibility domain-containing protein n=1 Tax=Fusarium vanettenii (strain ATCC MYA-4622 / CBS 123669 / FGSC 9596 / NRRL 45880 / 77-13-4) TaxID=660122 RepID=C7ZNK7_FUSV7|nr:uncharacterized protein NECHADRAFT_85399 [Fusarium vanettenii 77-13-4]EEU34183.1 hypothetical protein NECHADRAFT_85399 [Fusarium vanettenii 77-13-4]